MTYYDLGPLRISDALTALESCNEERAITDAMDCEPLDDGVYAG